MNISIPVSLGELYDKISILEIKSKNIKDQNKLYHIKKELDLLNKIASNHPIKKELYENLKNINKEIWDIEDTIRNLEKNKDFKERFVKTARSVYFKNDERANIKRTINILYDSEIVEEKSYSEYK